MDKIQVTVRLWIMFCMNYPNPKDVIKWVCDKTQKGWLYDHYYAKFCHICKTVGSHGAMNTFYCDCDKDIREALVEYAITVWAPIGMRDLFAKNKDILGL